MRWLAPNGIYTLHPPLKTKKTGRKKCNREGENMNEEWMKELGEEKRKRNEGRLGKRKGPARGSHKKGMKELEEKEVTATKIAGYVFQNSWIIKLYCRQNKYHWECLKIFSVDKEFYLSVFTQHKQFIVNWKF